MSTSITEIKGQDKASYTARWEEQDHKFHETMGKIPPGR